jgi:hypothetical protein
VRELPVDEHDAVLEPEGLERADVVSDLPPAAGGGGGPRRGGSDGVVHGFGAAVERERGRGVATVVVGDEAAGGRERGSVDAEAEDVSAQGQQGLRAAPAILTRPG